MCTISHVSLPKSSVPDCLSAYHCGLLQSSLHCRERAGTTFPRIPFSVWSRLDTANERLSLGLEGRSQYSLKIVASRHVGSGRQDFPLLQQIPDELEPYWSCRQPLRSLLPWEPSTLLSSTITVVSLHSPTPARLPNGFVSL